MPIAESLLLQAGGFFDVRATPARRLHELPRTQLSAVDPWDIERTRSSRFIKNSRPVSTGQPPRTREINLVCTFLGNRRKRRRYS